MHVYDPSQGEEKTEQLFTGFLRVGHWPSLLSAALHFEVSFMVWVLLGVLGNYIAEDFGLSASQKGVMTAVPILGGSLFRIGAGWLADRFGPHQIGLVILGFMLVPLTWGWLGASNFPHILAVGLLLGVAGASFAVALPLASRRYPPHYQGMALGIVGIGNSGTILASLFAPRLAEVTGWHSVFGLMMVPVAVVAGAFVLLDRDGPTSSPQMTGWNLLKVLRQEDVWWLCLLYSVTFGGFVGLSNFLAIFFHDHYGVGNVHAGALTALCVLAGSLFRPVGGYLSDRMGGVRMLGALLPLAGLLMLGATQLPALPLEVAFLFLALTCLGMGNGAVFQLVPLRFGQQIGIATGLVGAAGGIGGFVIPLLFGLLKDLVGTYAAGFLVMGIAAFTAWLVLMALHQSWRLTWLREVSSWQTPVLVEIEED